MVTAPGFITWRMELEKVISGYPSLLGGGRSTVNNLSTAGIVLGNGMTLDQLRNRLSTTVGNYDPSCACLHTDVSGIIQANGAPNPAYYGPGSTAGQFADLSYMYSKTTFEVDMSLNKDFKFTERLRMGINFQLYNALNHPFLPLASTSATATTFGTITSSTTGIYGTRTGQLRAYLSW